MTREAHHETNQVASADSAPAEVGAVSLVNRRLLLRGGALVAGAAAAAAASSVAFPRAAEAADGDAVVAGASNTAASVTSLTLTPGSASTPALTLTNASGPTLQLSSIGADFDGALQTGAIVNTDFGPVIGVDYGDGATVDILATGRDLEGLPTLYPVGPSRLLDTGTAAGREGIVRQSSSGAITTTGKLRAGQWIDIAVAPRFEGFAVSAVFGNAAVVTPETNGYLVVYPATTARPATSNLNYVKNVTLANAAFVGVGVFGTDYIVRIYSSATTRVVFDLSGAILGAPDPDNARTGSGSAPKGVRTTRATGHDKRLLRMRKSLNR